MRAVYSYDYAVLRIVPSVEREEFVNAGVVLQCPERVFLDCRVHVDRTRLQALWSGLDLDVIHQHLAAFPRICAGDPAVGPIAGLSRRERFQWLVAPRSTVIQVSAVHCGLCDSPETVLQQIFARMVLR